LFLNFAVQYELRKPRGSEVGWEATIIIYNDCVNVLVKHKHCKENAEGLSFAIKEVGLELSVNKPKRMFMFLKSVKDKITK
jgi:hypothetical protein